MTIIYTVILAVFGFLFGKIIRKQFNIFLGVSIVLSIGALVLQNAFFSFITDGYLGLAFFIVVMYAGAFEKGSLLNKKLRSVRKEYSILGFIVLMPHNIINLLYYLNGTLKVEWVGIIAVVIMIPLFITSFTHFKKKLTIKTWIKVQRFSYFAYLAIYLHLMLIGLEEHKLGYTIMFGVYSILKLVSSLREKSQIKLGVSIVGIVSIAVTVLFISPIDTGAITDVVEDVIVDVINNDNNDGVIDIVEVDDVIDVIDNSGIYTDGVHDGYSTGFQNMSVYVQVTVENGVIISIEIIEYGSTGSHKGINFVNEANDLRDEIVGTQSLDVDTVSGATYTTTGLISAVKDALGVE